MLRPLIATLALLSATPAVAQDARPSIAGFSRQASAAREAGNYPSYLRATERLRGLIPWSPRTTYNLARAYALNGRKAEAVAVLSELADAGWAFDAAGDALLAPVKGDAAFKLVSDRLSANGEPRGTAIARRKIDLAGKQPEGLAATADGTLYVGAIRDGIHRLSADGLTRLYTPEAGWGVVGLRVDTPRRELIACLSDEEAGKGRLVRLALPDLAPRVAIDLPEAGAFCNDSAVLPDGRVALTDSTGGRLWIADRSRIAEVKTSTPLIYPNGIAFGDGRLYVAHAAGLLAIDPTTGAVQEVKAGTTSLVGIDGLTWLAGTLFAVQNGTQPIRVLRVTPPAQLADDANVEVLAAGHSMLNGATTAAVIGTRLLVLTQTGIPNGSVPDDPMLVEVPIAR